MKALRAALALALMWLATAALPQSAPINVGASEVADSAIEARLTDILIELGGYEDVRVTVGEGVVRFTGTSATAGDIDALTALAERTEGVVAVRNTVTSTGNVTRRLNPALDRFETRWQLFVNALPLFTIAAIVFVCVLVLGMFVARLRWPWDRIAPNRFIADLLRQIVRLGFFVLAVVLALDLLNATALLSTILGAAGIIGLALGFAVRDTVENFIASILLSIRQPFQPNDTVEINGDEGKVVRLTSRATILMSFDGNQIRIPNSTVYKSRIVNFTHNAERRFLFELGVDDAADLEGLRALAEQTVTQLEFTLDDPAPSTWIDRLGGGGAALVVTGWIDQRDTSLVMAKGEALRKVIDALEAAGVQALDVTAQVLRSRAPAPDASVGAKPPAQPAAESVDVSPTPSEAALDRLIALEQADTEKPNLLKPDAPQE